MLSIFQSFMVPLVMVFFFVLGCSSGKNADIDTMVTVDTARTIDSASDAKNDSKADAASEDVRSDKMETTGDITDQSQTVGDIGGQHRVDGLNDQSVDDADLDDAVTSGADVSADVQTPIGVCVWNLDKKAAILNGHYIKAGVSNGADYYSKSVPTTDANACGMSNLYIFFSDLQWRIGPELGSKEKALAFCDSQTSLDSPFDCENGWTVTGHGVDSDSAVVKGACPHWMCASISVTYNEADQCTTGCCGEFRSSDKGPNVYERTDQTLGKVYWYFNPLRFRWQCGVGIDADCSATTLDEASDLIFHLIRFEQWIKLSGNTPSGDVYMQCKDKDSEN